MKTKYLVYFKKNLPKLRFEWLYFNYTFRIKLLAFLKHSSKKQLETFAYNVELFDIQYIFIWINI